MPVGKLLVVRELVAIDMAGGDEFVLELRRAWDKGNAVLPVDQRLPTVAKARVLEAMRPSWVVTGAGRAHRRPGEPVESGDALVMATSGNWPAATDRLKLQPARLEFFRALQAAVGQ